MCEILMTTRILIKVGGGWRVLAVHTKSSAHIPLLGRATYLLCLDVFILDFIDCLSGDLLFGKYFPERYTHPVLIIFWVAKTLLYG